MTDRKTKNPWLVCRTERPGAALRMFCVPYAGGGASVFNNWPNVFPETVELHAIQLPGRESRFREPALTDIYETAQILADQIEPYLDRPFALFGYSMGALIAFEIARILRRRGTRPPSQLFVAARRAPQHPRVVPPLTHLPLHSFLEEMRRYYDPPRDAWELPELLEIIIPTLRADMGMCDQYSYRPERPLELPVHAFAGTRDLSAPPDTVQEWARQTSGEFQCDVFEGAHFFLNTALSDIQKTMIARLERIAGNADTSLSAHP